MSSFIEMSCETCQADFPVREPKFKCPVCGDPLSLPLIPYQGKLRAEPNRGIWRYPFFLPFETKCSLGEGGSSLLPSSGQDGREGPVSSVDGVYYKLETNSISGSFKDRGSALVAAAALHYGVKKIAMASTGNAAASMAAYAARWDLQLRVIIPDQCDESKLWNIHSRGAQVQKIAGGFAAAERVCEDLVNDGWFPGGSDNPFRLEGTKTIAYEIHEQAHGAPVDRIIVPVGTGNLIAAIHKGFREIAASGCIDRLPRIDAVQLESVTPLCEQVEGESARPHRSSVATGINVPSAVLKKAAMNAVISTGGAFFAVADDEIVAAQHYLSVHEGLGVEPTAVVSVAAYQKGLRRGLIRPNENVVVMITGSLKSPACFLDSEYSVSRLPGFDEHSKRWWMFTGTG